MPSEPACLVALHAIKGMGPVTLRRLLEQFASAEDVLFKAEECELLEVPKLKPAIAREIQEARQHVDRAERAVARLAEKGIKLIRIGEQGYPEDLLYLRNPPPLLFVMGEIRPSDAKAMAIVGTTRPSQKGRAIARGFAARLSKLGCTIVSGYAHGIDSSGHRGALAAGGRTIMVVPYGVERFEPRIGYPRVEKLVRNAAVVSECPPQARWTRVAAIGRNRMVVALSRALLAVETGRRGGTINTIGIAHAHERPVFALHYGNPPPSASGNETVIAKGATAVRRYADVEMIHRAVEAELAKRESSHPEHPPC